MFALNQIPNILTVLRIILILPFAFAVYQANYTHALLIFFIAGLSDGVDGFLARQFNWKSRFGAIADPLADKLLLITAYVMLMWTNQLPLWLLLLILGRDLFIVIGALLYHYFVSHYEIKPSIFGKACTLIQIVYVLTLIISLAGWPMPVWAIEYGLYLVALITGISGIHYCIAWGYKAYRYRQAAN
jgi:cardiolipin synthase